MKASRVLLEKIKEFEGFRADAYLCPAGKLTIGYGTTAGVKKGMKVTKEQAEVMLAADLTAFAQSIEKLGLGTMCQHRFDAILDFCYNLGVANFKSSTLLKKIKANMDDATIPNEFRKWVYATVGGKKTQLPGLVKRREWEARRWLDQV